ncbi:MAG: (d)CMP kinase [candidate division SR1 bacterium]|nr:(d)CMP kinase [candidate division SR1 bacterium]
MSLKISISGPAGSGKSSLIAAIVKKYGMETADVGHIYRQRGIAKGLTISEYDKLVEMHPEEDIEMEREFKQIVENCPGDIIVSWRMGFHLLPNMTSIRLDVSPEEGAKRIFLDDRGKEEKKYTNIEEVIKTDHDRMERFRQRAIKLYGVDFTDTSHYTKVIDTTGRSFDENLEELEEFVKTLRK